MKAFWKDTCACFYVSPFSVVAFHPSSPTSLKFLVSRTRCRKTKRLNGSFHLAELRLAKSGDFLVIQIFKRSLNPRCGTREMSGPSSVRVLTTGLGHCRLQFSNHMGKNQQCPEKKWRENNAQKDPGVRPSFSCAAPSVSELRFSRADSSCRSERSTRPRRPGPLGHPEEVELSLHFL